MSDKWHDEFNFILEFIEAADFNEPIAIVQLRALWTAFCFHHNLDCDTREYDNCVLEMWNYLTENPSNPWPSLEFDKFDYSMGAWLS